MLEKHETNNSVDITDRDTIPPQLQGQIFHSNSWDPIVDPHTPDQNLLFPVFFQLYTMENHQPEPVA